ncbi:MAG: helix-turn-helix transcriptional regulator [Oscillospiraceae bacterium]|nr:helix-turn-helix transcriptional regulator [Oscillospiraceae bacterium]
MNICERIYKLRTAKNMSQGDLSELLDVSRQSISKWENNSAQPDLDKIVKLSDIFGVTIDELVKGKTDGPEAADGTESANTKDKNVEYIYVQPQRTLEARKIAGVILLCMAFLLTFGILFAVGSFGGIIYAAPFIVCGIICFTVANHTGIWCAWAIYIMVDIFMRWGTSINPNLIFMTFKFTPQMNYTRLVAAWVWVIILVLLIAFTAKSFKDTPIKNMCRLKRNIIIGWVLYLALYAGRRMLASAEIYAKLSTKLVLSNMSAYYVLLSAVNIAGILLAAVLVTGTAAYLNNKNKL